MPRYDFRCEECGNKFELSLSLEEREQETDKKNCPHCSSKQTRQVMSFNGGVVGGSKSGGGAPSGGGCSTGSCPFM